MSKKFSEETLNLIKGITIENLEKYSKVNPKSIKFSVPSCQWSAKKKSNTHAHKPLSTLLLFFFVISFKFSPRFAPAI